MAFNNGFPMTYQQYYPQYQPPMQQPQNNGVIWVQGEAGAKSYLVAPNTTVQLWDSESQTIYLKSADASGMPTMKVLDYTIRDSNKNPLKTAETVSTDKYTEFATKRELDGILCEIDVLKAKLEKIAPEV